jgi:transposase
VSKNVIFSLQGFALFLLFVVYFDEGGTMSGSNHWHNLTDTQWENLETYLPPRNTVMGHKMHERRQHINGMLGILKTGAPWHDLLKRYGKWGTVYARYHLWQLDGTWDLILDKLLIRFEADGKIDWSQFSVDGTIVKAHKSAAGALTKKSRRGAVRSRNWQVARRFDHKDCWRVRPSSSSVVDVGVRRTGK